MYRNAVYLPKNKIIRLYSWDMHGKRISYDTSFEPYIYLETSYEGDAKSIFNTALRKKTFSAQYERYKYVADNESQRIFENLPVTQQFLVDVFHGKNEAPEFSQFPLKLMFIDIETDTHDHKDSQMVKIRKINSGNEREITLGEIRQSKEFQKDYEIYDDGKWLTYHSTCYAINVSFPNTEQANQEVNIITVYDSLSQKYYTWSTRKCSKEIEDCVYVACNTEKQMFLKFLEFYESDYPDILSGWNSEGFDIPYIINRLNVLFGADYAQRLSPVGRMSSRTFMSRFGKQQVRWYIEGVSCIDYLDIYRKFCMSQRENYKLGNIGETELGESKVDFGDQTLAALSDTDWDLFAEYNVTDVKLLAKLERKLKYLELLRSIAYAGCTTFESALGTLSVVNGLCAIKARSKNLKIPTFNREDGEGKKNEGAYVGEPQKGFQEHIVSFDANSLYPNVMISLNLSPETKIGKIIEKTDTHVTIAHVNGQRFDITHQGLKDFLKAEKVTMSMASVLFSQKEKGIVPDIVDSYYKKRVEIQKKQDKFSRVLSNTEQEIKKLKQSGVDVADKEAECVQLKKEIEQFNIRQHTIKILINSIYGYFGNKHAPIGDDDLARSVTLTGQAAIKQSNCLMQEYIQTNANLPDDYLKSYDPVIYNDTDSCYISLKKVAEAKKLTMIGANGQVTQEYLDEVSRIDTHLNTGIKKWGEDALNSHDCRLVFKREVIADSGIFLSKKHYVLHILNNKGIPCDKYKYVGVEMVKTTMPKNIKPYAKKIVETMLKTKDKVQVDKVFNEAYETFKSLSIEDIAHVSGITNYNKFADKCNEFTTVKGMPKHVKAAYFYNLLLKRFSIDNKYESISSGDKIRYISVRQPNKFGLKAVGYKYYYPQEFKEFFEPDYEEMFDKLMFSVIERFYQAVNWQIRTPSMNTQTDLFDLFS